MRAVFDHKVKQVNIDEQVSIIEKIKATPASDRPGEEEDDLVSRSNRSFVPSSSRGSKKMRDGIKSKIAKSQTSVTNRSDALLSETVESTVQAAPVKETKQEPPIAKSMEVTSKPLEATA